MVPTLVKVNSIQQIKSVEEIRSCYDTVQQLRPHLTEETFVDQVQRQLSQGYVMACCLEEGKVQAVIGFRYLEFLAWGRILYIDDLITHSDARKNGYGSKLLKWAIEQAKDNNCDQVHLDSGHHRYDAHRLYLNHGFKITAHHLALGIKTPL